MRILANSVLQNCGQVIGVFSKLLRSKESEDEKITQSLIAETVEDAVTVIRNKF